MLLICLQFVTMFNSSKKTTDSTFLWCFCRAHKSKKIKSLIAKIQEGTNGRELADNKSKDQITVSITMEIDYEMQRLMGSVLVAVHIGVRSGIDGGNGEWVGRRCFCWPECCEFEVN